MTEHLKDEQLERLVPYSFKKSTHKLPFRRRGPRLQGAVLQHGIPAQDGEIFNLVFESANSDWEQSVTLVTDKTVRIGQKVYKKGVIVPYDSSRQLLPIVVGTREGMLWVWNSWQYRDISGILRRMSQLNYAGMMVDKFPNGFRYRCNEGRDDDDYDDLVFRIEKTRPF